MVDSADDHEGTYISANLEIRVALPVPDDPKGKTYIAHMREDEDEALRATAAREMREGRMTHDS